MTSPSSLRARRRLRGFTLIELMVVVVIIAVLAAVSVPMFVAKMRERRSQQTALQLASLYRDARMRALGRGAAVVVAYDGSNWQVREGIEGASGNADCQSLPTSGCLTNPWDGTQSRDIQSFDPTEVSSDISVTFADASTEIDICFTPLGRTFVRRGGSWSVLTEIVSINVKRGTDGLSRTVLLLPNGTSRLGL